MTQVLTHQALTHQRHHARAHIRHYDYAIVIVFGDEQSPWEVTVPDRHARFDYARVSLRQFGTPCGAEASVPMLWDHYVEVRRWLRCVPEGRHGVADLEPALKLLRSAFALLGAAAAL